LALNLEKYSSVATTPLTFVSTANAAYYAGHKLVFIDVDINTLNMDIELFSKKISETNIDALIAVHYAGNTADFYEIAKLAKLKNIKIIEDAAHALGSRYKTGEKVGSCKYSEMTVFSFHPVKSITTGEGGVITTNSEIYYRKLLRLRSHGINKINDELFNKFEANTNGEANPWYYEMQELGFHYRLTEIQAALGLSQMNRLENFIEKRQKIAKRYNLSFADQSNFSPAIKRIEGGSANHLYPISINFDKLKVGKARIISELRKKGIGTQVHYIPVPMQPFYKNLGYNSLDYPNALRHYYSALSIPIYPHLKNGKQLKVISEVENCLSKFGK
jgi:perosamine synthetase